MSTFSIYEAFDSSLIVGGINEKSACAMAKKLSCRNKATLYTVKKEGSALDGKSWMNGEKIPSSAGLTGVAW